MNLIVIYIFLEIKQILLFIYTNIKKDGKIFGLDILKLKISDIKNELHNKRIY
jgi:hypothetical protein